MSYHHQREVAVFEAALNLPPEQRETYLQETCAADPELLQRVRALLKAGESQSDFLAPAACAAGPAIGASFPPTEKTGDSIGPYKLLQQIGEGGCGVVYMAEQVQPIRRRVALKIIKLGMDTRQVVARFEAERQALALMDHPNIAKVHDAGATATGRPYFVMELVRGLKITEYCDGKKLPTRQRLELFIQVCQAVQHAHQKGIIHRDLKPSNVLVTVNDGAPVVKVIDFGIAKATSGERLTDKTIFTAFEQFVGTPAYMSPEQAELTSVDIDTRSDIYSLGVLLYELLTGQTPFDAKELLRIGLDEMRRTIREKEPARPSTRLNALGVEELTTAAQRRGLEPPKLVNVVRGDLDWIAMKCLEKDRARRYETANGLARDIQRHLSNEPVVARPPNRLYEFRKTVRRHRFGFAATGAVIFALLLGLATAISEYQKERGALRQAQTEAAKSKRIAQLFKDVLHGVNPSVALGRDTAIVRDVLERTVTNVAKDLVNEPEVEVELRAVISETYRDLTLYREMETNNLARLQVARTRLGTNSLDVASALAEVGAAEYSLGKQAEAERSLKDAEARFRRLGGTNSSDFASCLNTLALVLWDEGKLQAAERMFRESLSVYKKARGDQDPYVATLLNNLGLVLRSERKFNLAEQAFKEALALNRKVSGDASPGVMLNLCNLGLLSQDENRLEKAVEFHRQAFQIACRTLGTNHLDVAWTGNSLGEALRKQGKLAEAEILQRDALTLRRRLLGEEHPDVAQSLSSLASTLEAENRTGEALPLLRQALAIDRKVLGPDHPAVATLLSTLAHALESSGDLAGAEISWKETLAVQRKVLAPTDRGIANTLANIGRILLEQGNGRDAEKLLRECMTIREEVMPDTWQTYNTKSALGGALLEQREYGEAEPLLLAGYEGLQKADPSLPSVAKPRIREAIQRLVSLYEQTGRPAQAAQWKAKLADFEKANGVKAD